MATRNIVPRANGEGSIGTSAKQWGAIRSKQVVVDGVDITEQVTETTNKADEAANSAAIAQSLYNAFIATYGYPFTAATAASMTDTSKIYVYVGSETGYTNGNWYYYNGSAWVSGGVYNSTAFETDKTISIEGKAADAKVTGEFLEVCAKRELSPNIFPGYTESGYIKDDGTNGSNVNLVRSDYVELDINESTLYFKRENARWGINLFFYDENKTFLEKVELFSSSSDSLTTIIAKPENAKYLRTYRTQNNTSWIEISYEQLEKYYPYGYLYGLSEDVQAAVEAQKDLTLKSDINIFNGYFPITGYFDADGVNAYSGSFVRTDYIEVNDTHNKLNILRTTSPYYLALCFYDDNKVGFGRIVIFNGGSTELTSDVTIPSGAKYLRMYTNLNDYSGGLMLSYEHYQDFIRYGGYLLKDKVVVENNLSTELQTKINSQLFLNGKTIAFFGDSIIGNFYDNSGICAVLAQKTGATVINCAFGGTRIGYRYGSSVQYQYWNALSGAGLADAVASGDWTAQDEAVENMTGGKPYFVERLDTIKDIDWSAVDYVMWEYGTNDFMTEVALSDTSDPTNLYAYDNAYRHAIEAILTAYPNIRIITVTPAYRWYQSEGEYTEDSNTHIAYDYKGDPHKLTDFVAMAESVSREYQIPCIDNYYTLGANKFTRLAFWNSSDGTHPNAQGRQRMAEHIAAGLKALIC